VITPVLSIVVCTYNRERLLDNCLASICKQNVDREHYEVIVVDNNSKDDTRRVVSRYVGEDGNIRYVTEENQGLSYARNRGCREASGIYLGYIDDDAIAPAQYVSKILEVIEKYGPDILGGPVYPFYGGEKPRWFEDEYETRKHAEKSGFSRTCRISGGNFIIKKAVLERIGMFDVKLGMRGDEMGFGEDAKVLDVYRFRNPEVNQKVYYGLELFVRHYVPEYKMKIGYMLKRAFIYGRMHVRSGVIPGKMTLCRVLRIGIGNVMEISRRFVNGISVHGLRRVEFVIACRFFSSCLGMIVEGLNQVVEKRK